jgi:hypothetical protein
VRSSISLESDALWSEVTIFRLGRDSRSKRASWLVR